MLYRRRYAHHGHGRPEEAIVGLGGQVFMRENSQEAFLRGEVRSGGGGVADGGVGVHGPPKAVPP